MRKANKVDMTIREQIASVKDRICDNVCKHEQEYLGRYKDPDVAWEMMQREECSKCPMSEL